MSFVFSQRSLNSLKHVHADLVKVCHATLALSPVDFAVIEGRRTGLRQHELFMAGKSQIDFPSRLGMPIGRHLTGKAIDFMAFVDGVGTFVDEYYPPIVTAAKKAAHDLSVPIVCGIDWESFKDSGHIELDRVAYPDTTDIIA